jgi:YD repeat-containing protein
MRLAFIAAAFSLFACGANAEGGIDFAAMPKGCSWLTRFSDDLVQRTTFVGKVKGKYRVESVNAASGTAINHVDYNADGLMVRRNWADGRWEQFEPFSCFTVPGKCNYTYRNGAGDDVRIDSFVRTKASGFTSDARPRGGDAYPTESFTLGPFGLPTSSRSANYSTKIIGFEGCGPGV